MAAFSDPLALFRAAIDALNTEDWDGVAVLVDPVSLQVFTRQLRERIDPVAPTSFATADDHMMADPQLPREVAEHFATEARRHADPDSRLARELPGVASLEELRALTPAQVFRHWLHVRSPRRQVERLLADGNISQRAADARAAIGFATNHYRAVGVVFDGENIAHILYRDAVDPAFADTADWLTNQPEDERALSRDLWVYGHPSIATCRRQSDGTWRFIVEHDFLRVGQTHITGIEVRDRNTP